MRLLRLQIERFRAVQALDWTLTGSFACLIGPGDSGKSSIIEALRLVTAPGPVAVRDSDFYGAETAAGLSITATFTDIPDSLCDDRKFGLYLGGVSDTGALLDEPNDTSAGTLTIRLDIGSDLEPVWRVISAAHPDGKPIVAADRRLMSVGVITPDLTADFTWAARGPLARASDKADVAAICADATAAANAAVADVDLSALAPVVAATRTLATALGAGRVADRLDAAVDPLPVEAREIALVADDLRLDTVGTGTRRLLAIAAHLASVPSGAVVAVDEIELGLEPHRIRRLLAGLRATTGAGGTGGQVLFTSHSPPVIAEVGLDGLFVVRNDDGVVSIISPDPALIATVRAAPAALLARRVVVCEGKTEAGLLWGCDEGWAARHDGRSLGYQGVAVFTGGGTEAPDRAVGLRRLGYPVLLFADSDRPLTPTAEEMRAEGIEVVQWDGAMCTEERVLSDLSWDGVVKAFAVAAALHEPAPELITLAAHTACGQQVLRRLGIRRVDIGDDLAALRTAGFTDDEVRICVYQAATAKRQGWFKQYESARALGEVVVADPLIAQTPTGAALAIIEAWCYTE